MDETFDPIQKVDLAMIRAEHQKRFQIQITMLKERVGEGLTYRNGVVQVVFYNRSWAKNQTAGQSEAAPKVKGIEFLRGGEIVFGRESTA